MSEGKTITPADSLFLTSSLILYTAFAEDSFTHLALAFVIWQNKKGSYYRKYICGCLCC